MNMNTLDYPDEQAAVVNAELIAEVDDLLQADIELGNYRLAADTCKEILEVIMKHAEVALEYL